jgi:hypothetical protein
MQIKHFHGLLLQIKRSGTNKFTSMSANTTQHWKTQWVHTDVELHYSNNNGVSNSMPQKLLVLKELFKKKWDQKWPVSEFSL